MSADHLNFPQSASAVGSSMKVAACLLILERFRPIRLRNWTLSHCLPRSHGDGWAVPGVCLTRSERFGHGQLLTHGILQGVKFKQDLSRP